VLIAKKSKITRHALPRIDTLLEWGAVNEGDVIVAKGKEDKGTLLANNGNVMAEGKEKSMQVWLKEVFGWSGVQTYVFAVHEESGKRYLKYVRSIWNKRNL